MSDDDLHDGHTKREERVEAEFRVGYPTVDKLLVAYTQDMSKGGIFLKTERFLPINAVLRLHIVLPDDGGEVAIVARVAYVRGVDEAKERGNEAGMGIQFLDMSGANSGRIEKFIAGKLAPQIELSGPIVLARQRVLVIDDDEYYRGLAAKSFRDRGDEVITANDGLDGLAACLKMRPDVILCDVQMPKMDGWAFLRLIRARPSLASVPVIFLTMLSGEDERLKGYRLGVDDYIGKPYKASEVVARVERVVYRARKHSRAHSERRALRGDLEQVALPSVLSFLALERHTGVLLVVGQDTARLMLREGRPVAVRVDDAPKDMKPLDVALALLRWQKGQFEFSSQDVAEIDELDISLQGLLLEAARRADEEGHAHADGDF